MALAAAAVALLPAQPASAGVEWLCRPTLADNPCEIPGDTTVREAGKPDRVETPKPGPRLIDCFYVYPTVSNQPTANANKNRDPELESIAKYQAAPFSEACRVYAPIYRQSTLASIATGYASASGADRQLAYGDVLEAWRAYLEKDNDGRGVVLIGHSQGTSMLRQLLRREIEASDHKRRVVSALLIGGNVTVKAGDVVGGDFRETPLCTQPVQVRCVVAFSTFAEDPPRDARFGISKPPPADNPSTLPGGPGYEIACTDPRPLTTTWRGPLRMLTPSEPFAPGTINSGIAVTSGGPPPTAPTTWVVAPDRFEGGCRKINGAHVLRYDPLPGSRRPRWYPDPNWGTHLVDVNLAYEPLVALVREQAERWTAPQVRLTRTCARGGLRVQLTGRDAEFVRDASFKLGRRLAARDADGAFDQVIPRRLLRRTRARAVRAVAYLRAGQPARTVLERTLPRC